MISAKQKTKEVQGLLDQSNALVDSMWWKQKKNKFILGGLAAFVLLFVLYHMI